MTPSVLFIEVIHNVLNCSASSTHVSLVYAALTPCRGSDVRSVHEASVVQRSRVWALTTLSPTNKCVYTTEWVQFFDTTVVVTVPYTMTLK